MRQEIEEWARSTGSPGVLLAVGIGTLVAPLAVDAMQAITDASASPITAVPTREWDDRLFERISGPAGATIIGVVVIYLMYKLVMSAFDFIMADSKNKDETIKSLISKIEDK